MKSQSALTRRVFRAIIANRPYHSATCSLPAVNAYQHVSRPPRASPHRQTQRRNLFGFTLAVPRVELAGSKSTSQNVETALGKMSEYVEANASRSRPPPTDRLVDALRFLVSARRDAGLGLTRNDAFLVEQTLQYLLAQEGQSFNDPDLKHLQTQDLANLLAVLAMSNAKLDLHRVDIQRLAEIAWNKVAQFEDQGDWLSYISALSNTGAAEKALKLLTEKAETDGLTWSTVLAGLIKQQRADLVWPLLRQDKIPEPEVAFGQLVSVFASMDNLADLRQLHEITLSRGYQLEPSVYIPYVQACIRQGQFDPARDIIQELEASTTATTPLVAATLLTWYAAQQLSVRELEAKIQSLLDRGAELTAWEMNHLVQYAYSQQAPDLADTYIQLAQTIGIVPDAETYALKLDYELSQNNLPAAHEAFEGLSIQDTPIERSEALRLDISALTHYITALASTPKCDLQHINRVIDRITDTNGSLNAEVLAALTSVYLSRDLIPELISLLRYRVDTLESSERLKISTIFQQYITDPSISDTRAWRAYDLFRHAFASTPPPARIPLMQSFFLRKRSDLACLVFGHMRAAPNHQPQNRPDAACYAAAFYGIASCRDVDGLQMIYNMLKMDIHVEQSTRVRNAMMAAYTACQTPFSAIIDHYWKILDSREGPTLSTFKLALRACEAWIGAGGEEARRIMALLQKWEVPITKDVYDCYIGALAGQSQFENCVELIECMEQDIGVEPDATTIGTFYNAIPWQYRKDEVEGWAKRRYPELWEGLVAMGDEIDEDWDVRYFRVDRRVDVDDGLLFGGGGVGDDGDGAEIVDGSGSGRWGYMQFPKEKKVLCLPELRRGGAAAAANGGSTLEGRDNA